MGDWTSWGVFRSTSASAAASTSRVDADVVEGKADGKGDGDSRATPGCEGRRPEVARGLAVVGERGGASEEDETEGQGERGAIAEEECPVCAVVLKVSPAEDVVRYDSCRALVVSSCGRPEVDENDAEEGGSGGSEDSDPEGAGVDSANKRNCVSINRIQYEKRERRT
jgi:hypothetical protein